MQERPSRYRAYLLRLWRVDDGASATWRASLQDVRTGQRTGFADLEGAIAYLRRAVASAPGVKDSREV